MKPTKLRLSSDLDGLSYPVICQPKFNGVRCLVHQARCLSNSGKVLPSEFVKRFSYLVECDGEIICGEPTYNDVLRRTTSAIMTVGSETPVKYHVFDWFGKPDISFIRRYNILEEMHNTLLKDEDREFVELVPNIMCRNKTEILSFEEKLLSQGHEGVIIRSPDSPYKHGRSTVREGYLLALKRREVGVAVITDVNEMMNNYNEAVLNEHGYTKRSHAQDGQYAADMLGSLTVKATNGPHEGAEFNIGTGFTLLDRAYLWKIRSSLIGMSVLYSYFSVGVFNKPLHAAYRGML